MMSEDKVPCRPDAGRTAARPEAGRVREAAAIALKSARAEATADDGYRILVDRLWPRGLSKARLRLDEWNKDIAPSTELRKWFNHDPARWEAFKRRYFRELEDRCAAVDALRAKIRERSVTLVFAARDARINHAVALKEYIESKDAD